MNRAKGRERCRFIGRWFDIMGPTTVLALWFLMSGTATAFEGVAPPESKVTRFLSPDGARTAHALTTIGLGRVQTHQIVIDLLGAEARRPIELPVEEIDEVLWYGNDRILYAESSDSGTYSIVSLTGESLGTLAFPGTGYVVHKTRTFSPDGRKLAFIGHRMEGSEAVESGLRRGRRSGYCP